MADFVGLFVFATYGRNDKMRFWPMNYRRTKEAMSDELKWDETRGGARLNWT